MLRLIFVKIRHKLAAILKKLARPVQVLPVECFFDKRFAAQAPDQNYFTTRTYPRFFFDHSRRESFRQAYLSHFSKEQPAIIVQAEKYLEHKFDLLGSSQVDLGETIDWHSDFKSGFSWPQENFTRIKIVELDNHADVKIPWELSRLQHLSTLGRAYWLTNDAKYKEQFIFIISDWLKHNPVDNGVNWTCSMEVGIRAINIIWGMYFFGSRGELPQEFIKKVIHSLYYHALHIERNLEIIDEGSNSNHLIANYLGLYYVGLLFSEFDRSKKWLTTAVTGLEKEMLLQVAEDGADYECSLPYHRLVLEMFLSAFILGKINDSDFSAQFTARLAKMAEFSAAMTAPSGKAPAIGDNDDGFVIKLANSDPHDHLALLDIAAQFLDVKIPENVKLSEERLWYTGANSLGQRHGTVPRKSCLFKKSGYGVIQNEKMHLVLNACGIAPKALGGHKHNDLLSLNLEIDSVPFLIDAGTGCYTSDYHLRNKSRSTAKHNTIMIDSAEQARFLEKRLFFMYRDAHPRIDLWTVTDKIVLVSAYHDGYSRQGKSIIHRRTLEVDLANRSIDIWDEITGDGDEEHFIESNFLTPLECHKNKNSNDALLASPAGVSLMVEFSSPSELHLHAVPTDYYPTYGTLKKGTQLCCKCRTKLPFKLTTRMVCDSNGNSFLPKSELTGMSTSRSTQWQRAL